MTAPGLGTVASAARARRRLELLLVALSLGTAFPLPAQQPLQRTVFGFVLDSLSGRPLGRAEVYFTTAVAQSRSGTDGRFWLEGSDVRDSVLIVRRIGYVPRTVVVTPAARLAAIDVGPVYLRPVATELDEFLVVAEEVRRYPVLDGFYQRRKLLSGLGHFFTREFVERSAALRTSDVLRRSHKVEIECGKQVGGLCYATSHRARETRLAARTRDSTEIEDGGGLAFETGRCRMEIWVDGVRNPLDVDLIPVDWIVGIEIYSGPGTVPPLFGMGPCGVVAIWTVVAGA